MIKHIVMFELKNEYAGKSKEENLPLVLKTLRGLANIEGVKDLKVHLNNKSDPYSKEADLVLEATFESQEALELYRNDPAYMESISIVKPLRLNRWAVDYNL